MHYLGKDFAKMKKEVLKLSKNEVLIRFPQLFDLGFNFTEDVIQQVRSFCEKRGFDIDTIEMEIDIYHDLHKNKCFQNQNMSNDYSFVITEENGKYKAIIIIKSSLRLG